MRRFDQEWQLLVAARKWLRDRGYRLLDSRGPEDMEQGFDVYAGEQLGIRIVADRAVDGRTDGFRPYPTEPAPHERPDRIRALSWPRPPQQTAPFGMKRPVSQHGI
jgi:hypothetical protein